MFFPPFLFFRSRYIVKKFTESGAVDVDSAVTPEEAGVIFPDRFSKALRHLLRHGVIVSCLDGRYYIGKD